MDNLQKQLDILVAEKKVIENSLSNLTDPNYDEILDELREVNEKISKLMYKILKNGTN